MEGKKERRDPFLWCGGCLVFAVAGILTLGAYFTHMEKKFDQRVRDANDSFRKIVFVPGKTGIKDILAEEPFVNLTLDEKLIFDDARYFEWDHGMVNAWMIGNPVEILFVHSHWGSIRLNNFVSKPGPERSLYPDQEELQTIIDRIEDIYRENPATLGGGYEQHNLYALRELREGKVDRSFPPKPRGKN
ncbi:MAG: hypothetical protein H6752_10470 [Candidatus Omnitrophica bacterium]|nr:hypothetical protein [Candidatus Omnitrophota bacterium]